MTATTEVDPLHPALPLWPRVGRYAFAIGVGALVGVGSAVERLDGPLPESQQGTVIVVALDLVLGLVSLGLLALRRRHPLAVACTVVALLSVSAASFGPALVAIVSMGTWRRRPWAVLTGGVFLAGLLVVIALDLPTRPPDEAPWEVVVGLVLAPVVYGAAAVTGFYVGARRELAANRHEQALAAEREQALVADTVREAERTRIAREMHDVLAHRISLVALHAGALVYRDDLTREQTAETAATIQDNAQLALTELRQVLGVLRPDDGAHDIESPQPTLAELPALLADSREAGTEVALDTTQLVGTLDRVPTTLSRNAFRIVQEALTNVRKHAPGVPVRVALAGTPGARLDVEVSNPIGARAGVALPSAGVGLTGLTERAVLAGGTLEHGARADGSFVVEASLPWQT
ncbi:sensor histidine kinase [Trujillonella endophytica]|uniref:histidine kinase n=1 Tax=Trujillonella endophytica TaxID=673521 RepID=A0A1H8VH21_9ACTN|nr:histidine kinase [Trujillella endophytica]SEP14701.1 Histidine kinase [Trujillella endophytica]